MQRLSGAALEKKDFAVLPVCYVASSHVARHPCHIYRSEAEAQQRSSHRAPAGPRTAAYQPRDVIFALVDLSCDFTAMPPNCIEQAVYGGSGGEGYPSLDNESEAPEPWGPATLSSSRGSLTSIFGGDGSDTGLRESGVVSLRAQQASNAGRRLAAPRAAPPSHTTAALAVSSPFHDIRVVLLAEEGDAAPLATAENNAAYVAALSLATANDRTALRRVIGAFASVFPLYVVESTLPAHEADGVLREWDSDYAFRRHEAAAVVRCRRAPESAARYHPPFDPQAISRHQALEQEVRALEDEAAWLETAAAETAADNVVASAIAAGQALMR